MKRRYRDYRSVKHLIRDGDLLNWRADPNALSRVTAKTSRGEHSHSSLAARRGLEVICLETIAGIGCRAVDLENLVWQYPGQCDVFRGNYHSLAAGSTAVEYCWRQTGLPYGRGSWWRCLLRRIPIIRVLMKTPTDDQANGSLPDCSGLVARAVWAAGDDPVPNLSDDATEPADLVRSEFFGGGYLFTLICDD